MSCNIITESGSLILTESSMSLSVDGICTVDQTITWLTGAYVFKDLDIIYDVGQGILKWYRIQGACAPCAYNNNCETTGLQVLGTQCLAGTIGSQFLIQNILATSVSEVCQILQDSKLNWEICTIKVYSRPADPALSGPEDICNTLSDVPFENLPECLPIYVQEKTFVKMRMTAYVVEFNFTAIASGGLTTEGEAIVSASVPGSGPDFEFISLGLPSLEIDSQTEYNSSWQNNFLIPTKMNVLLTYFQTILNYQDNNDIMSNAAFTVNTVCGNCNSMPSLIYAFHNFKTVTEIKNFLNNNYIDFPDSFIMRYNRIKGIWNANYHMIGEGNLGAEKWNFNFNWYCTDYAAEEYVNPFWKFSININRFYLDLNLDFYTKIHIVFPPDYLCIKINNLLFDLPFSLNTVTKYVKNDFVSVTEDVIISDNIGLFKNATWKINPQLNLTLSSTSTQPSIETKDLTPIIP